MGKTAEERTWKTQYLNVTIIPSATLCDTSWQDLRDSGIVPTLERGISLAPVMVREAVRHLLDHCAAWEAPSRSWGSFQKWQSKDQQDPDHSEVGLALMKYFSLEYTMSDYWRFVRGILKVYTSILAGLTAPYELVVGVFDGRGMVKFHGNKVQKDVSAIRQIHGFVDEWGHSRWEGFDRAGRIQLNLEYIGKNRNSPDHLARTIVHEASHKWAGTRDLLYKDDTFAKTGFENEPEQDKVAIPGRDKPLLPMAGFVGKTNRLIQAEQLLENADSYAWTARRLWKRSDRPIE